jgi:glycosyltransferase involved in cell wall biosynthesis
MPQSLSILITAYNEEANIQRTVEAVLREIPCLIDDWEIVFVESGSADNSLQVIKEYCAAHENMRYLHQETKEGMGAALRAGYPLCTKEWICHLEADLPYDLIHVRKAVPYFDDYDFIRGYRSGSDQRDSWWFYNENGFAGTALRTAFHYGYYYFLRGLYNLSVRDVNYSFKFVRREMVDKLDLRSNGWFIDTELYLEMVKAGARIKAISIKYNMREAGKSTVSLVSPFPIINDALAYRLKRWRK